MEGGSAPPNIPAAPRRLHPGPPPWGAAQRKGGNAALLIKKIIKHPINYGREREKDQGEG